MVPPVVLRMRGLRISGRAALLHGGPRLVAGDDRQLEQIAAGLDVVGVRTRRVEAATIERHVLVGVLDERRRSRSCAPTARRASATGSASETPDGQRGPLLVALFPRGMQHLRNSLPVQISHGAPAAAAARGRGTSAGSPVAPSIAAIAMLNISRAVT